METNNKNWSLLSVKGKYAIFIIRFSPATKKHPMNIQSVYLHSVWNTWADVQNYLNYYYLADAYIVNLETCEVEW